MAVKNVVPDYFTRYGGRVLYWMLFAVIFLYACADTVEAIHISTATKEELAQYPWGLQWGGSSWHYCSKDTYFAASMIFSFIGWQSLAVSQIFYRLDRQRNLYRLIALAILALPVLLLLCLALD